MYSTLTADEAYRANLRGAGIMVLSMASFTANDAAMKLAMRELPFGEAIFLRGAAISLVLLLVALRGRRIVRRLATRDRVMLALRTVGEVGSTLLYLQALRHLPIADLSAIMQVLPLLVTLTATLVFRERIGWRRLAAIAVGMVGVLLILRPGTPRFDIWSWVALASVGLIVLRELTTRAIGAHVRSSTIALTAAISVTSMGLLMPSPEPWRLPTPAEALQLGTAAGLLSIGYLTAVAAMRVGDISFVSPFRYASLLVAIVLGLALFGEWPDVWTWTGSALVVGAGVYVILREARFWGKA